jgi:hypothetical protein
MTDERQPHIPSAKVEAIREMAEQRRAEGELTNPHLSTEPLSSPELTTMSREDAERLQTRTSAKADEIRDGFEDLKALVDEAKAGNAHLALGYPSWTAYLADTLHVGEPFRLPREERRELVGYLTGEGMSTRAIGVVAGISEGTVRNDLRTELASFPKPGAQT